MNHLRAKELVDEQPTKMIPQSIFLCFFFFFELLLSKPLAAVVGALAVLTITLSLKFWHRLLIFTHDGLHATIQFNISFDG